MRRHFSIFAIWTLDSFEQPQRKADDAGGMRKHPLDRKMGLAGVGGTEHGRYATAWSAAVGEAGR